MARPLQSATLSFGLVSIPVKFYTAANSKSVSFHLLHAKDGSRIKEQILCKEEEKPISRDEVVKGFEVRKVKYVELSSKELKALEAEANRNVQIQEFLPTNAIDPVYIEKTYYLAPDKGGEKAYRLLAEAMHRQEHGAIAQFVRRGKDELGWIRATDEKRLLLHVLYYADEVREFSEAPSGKVRLEEKEVKMATSLIEQLAEKRWKPNKYRDQYRQRVLALIRRKEKGEEIVEAKPERRKGEVVDLMEALKRSLAHSGKQPKRSSRKPQSARKSA